MCQMQDGVFYDLRPPAIIVGKRFHRVQCEYQVPGKSNEYVVKGIPEGGEKEESFVLRFTKKGRVKAFRSEGQGPQVIKLRRKIMTNTEITAIISKLESGCVVSISLEGGDCIDQLEVDGLSSHNEEISGVGFRDDSDLIKIDDKWLFFPDGYYLEKKGTAITEISIRSDSRT